jgi:hypothetical protein
MNRASERRAQWVLDRAQLDSLEADLRALIRTHGLIAGPVPSGR